ncbi:C-X-C motif chemokine 19 [Clupea harengus]|uniref:C-X-C motif chemokine n=1 Tax=Clupea harengus TaxID=7950 RepID=A0A6P3VQB0_CLUHA|nr:C-X-C motif chemokine 19 [Clupea harengus]
MNGLLLLMWTGTLIIATSGMQPLGRGYNSHCLCLGFESRVIPQERLRSVEILPRGPHCKSAEIVAHLVTGEKICLNPRAVWVRKLVRYMMEKEAQQQRA